MPKSSFSIYEELLGEGYRLIECSFLKCIILQIAKALRPFLPDTAKAIFARFGVDPEIKTIGPALAISVKKGEPLFKRIQ